MKIKIKLNKADLLSYTESCNFLFKMKEEVLAHSLQTHHPADRDNEDLEIMVDFENLRTLLLHMITKQSSAMKFPQLNFDANQFLSVKRIIERSGARFDQYYQILWNEFYEECRKQIIEGNTVVRQRK